VRTFRDTFSILYAADARRAARFYYADDATDRLRAAGCEEVVPPQDEPWAEQRAYFRDPNRRLLHIKAEL
jgi:uncharacterized glyoxalase superfamily protein PhnB